MKSLINSRVGFMFLTLMVLTSSAGNAAVEDFQLSIRNVTQPTSNTLEFDVYLLDTDAAQQFELASCQLGFLLNSLIYNGGVLTVTIDNTDSGLDSDQQYVYMPDVVSSLAGYSELTLIRLAANSAPPFPPGAGSGTIISNSGDGTLLTHFTLTSTVDFIADSRPDLIFCSSSATSPFYPTKVNAYIDDLDIPLTVTPGTNAIVVGNPVLNQTPSLFNVTGSGSYCEGGDGLPVGLSGSEIGVIYILYKDAVAQVPTVTGDGNPIAFGDQFSGTYSVTGTNLFGTTTVGMTGSAVIVETSIPTEPVVGTITQPTCSVATGSVVLSGLPTGSWTLNPGPISGSTTEYTVTGLTEGQTYNFTVTNAAGCISLASANVVITAQPTIPSNAGVITGPTIFTPGTTGIVYFVAPITGAISYVWDYNGSGVTINGSGNSVTIDFSTSATAGTLSVDGTNSCGNGTASTLYLSPSTKTLSLTSVLLEGLYDGDGTMREASNGSGSQYPGIADYITVELHSATSYSTIIHSASNVDLSTSGAASLSIPGEYSDSYYITIKNRNHIETTTAAPVSFSTANISYAFDLPSKAYSGNLKFFDEVLDHYTIYGGDSNSDGVADGLDLISVENGATLFSSGYVLNDLNGDGIVDALDLILVENNALNFVMAMLPL